MGVLVLADAMVCTSAHLRRMPALRASPAPQGFRGERDLLLRHAPAVPLLPLEEKNKQAQHALGQIKLFVVVLLEELRGVLAFSFTLSRSKLMEKSF